MPKANIYSPEEREKVLEELEHGTEVLVPVGVAGMLLGADPYSLVPNGEAKYDSLQRVQVGKNQWRISVVSLLAFFGRVPDFVPSKATKQALGLLPR